LHQHGDAPIRARDTTKASALVSAQVKETFCGASRRMTLIVFRPRVEAAPPAIRSKIASTADARRFGHGRYATNCFNGRVRLSDNARVALFHRARSVM
jgi:hypothetical protein